jgi:hypothetical protein
MNGDDDLLQKIKTMSKEELADFLYITTIAGRLFTILGVGMILLALVFTNVFTIPLAMIIVYIASQYACSVDEVKEHIEQLINS